VWPAFEEAGFRVDEVPSLTEKVGHAQLLIASPEGRFEAVADPRSDGGAAAR
jgi:gamma-glutamyltranspeptidase